MVFLERLEALPEPLGSAQVVGLHLPVSHLYRCARRRTGVKMAAVPPVTSF
jgi:hypothetical protein